MESIADAAELSPSTLYRTFRTKDSIILDRFRVFTEQICGIFARHSEHHPVDEALAEAIFSAVEQNDRDAAQTLLVRSIIDNAPTARARLWDYINAQQKELSQLIAERLKTKADDLRAALTAQLIMTIVGLAVDRWRASGGKRASRKTAEELMLLLERGEVVFPRLKNKPARRPRRAKP
jgi:AcrR family transcriptional regulator